MKDTELREILRPLLCLGVGGVFTAAPLMVLLYFWIPRHWLLQPIVAIAYVVLSMAIALFPTLWVTNLIDDWLDP